MRRAGKKPSHIHGRGNACENVPAIRLFRPLAEAGNPKARTQIGIMYRKGESMAPSPIRAFMWFSFAAKRGDGKAKAGSREVSRTMTPAEMSQGQAMGEACAASNYRACEY
jgi:TPR repeat protein